MSFPHKLNVVSEETETENGDSDDGDYTNTSSSESPVDNESNDPTYVLDATQLDDTLSDDTLLDNLTARVTRASSSRHIKSEGTSPVSSGRASPVPLFELGTDEEVQVPHSRSTNTASPTPEGIVSSFTEPCYTESIYELN